MLEVMGVPAKDLLSIVMNKLKNNDKKDYKKLKKITALNI